MRTHNKPLYIKWRFIKGDCKKRASAYLITCKGIHYSLFGNSLIMKFTKHMDL